MYSVDYAKIASVYKVYILTYLTSDVSRTYGVARRDAQTHRHTDRLTRSLQTARYKITSIQTLVTSLKYKIKECRVKWRHELATSNKYQTRLLNTIQ